MLKFRMLLLLVLLTFIPACAKQPQIIKTEVVSCDIPISLLNDCLFIYPIIETNGDLLQAYAGALLEIDRCSIDKQLIRAYIEFSGPQK